MKNIQDFRKESILQKKMRFTEGVMTRKEWLDMMRVKGAYVVQSTKNRIQYNRVKYNRMSNWNGEQDAYEKKCNEKVTCYNLYAKKGDSSFWEITKTEFDYFSSAALSEDLLTQKYDLSERIEAGIATEQELNKDLEGFTKGEWKINYHTNESRYLGDISCDLGKDENGIMNIRTIAVVLRNAGNEEAKANAEHIVKCVNSHSELCAMLRQAVQYLNEETTVINHIHFFRHVEELLTKVK